MSNKIYYQNRGDNLPPPPPPRKFDFCKFKKNTICSLNEVECFLNNLNKVFKGVKLYKILK